MMGYQAFPEQEQFPEGHPSQERRTNRDVRLRPMFRIVSRPRHGEPVWERRENGQWVQYPQSKALAVIGAEQLARDIAFSMLPEEK